MSQHRVGAICAILFCIVCLVASCGRDRSGGQSDDVDIAVKIAITQTAIALEAAQTTTDQSSATTDISTPMPTADQATASSSSTSESTQSDGGEQLNLLSPAEVARIVGPDLSTDPPLPLYYLNESGQISRLEADGSTQTQLTNEPMPVQQYDVAPTGERIVYVSNNRLIELDTVTGVRTVLVDNAALDPSTGTLEDRITQAITDPRFSADGKNIIFGLNGIKQVESGAGLVALDQIESLLENDPYPDFSNSRTSFSTGPLRFYQPLSWSPDSRYILSEFSYYPEGGGLVILDVDSSTLIELWSNEPDAALCCEATWSADGQSLLIASSQVAYGAPGLTRVHAPTGEGTLLVRGFPIEPLSEENPFRFVRGPFILNPETHLVFLSQQTTIGGTAPYMMQVIDDGPAQNNVLRPEGFAINGDILWAEDGRGAIVINVQDAEQYPPTGPMFWVPVKGETIFELPAQGHSPQWATMAITGELSDADPADGPRPANTLPPNSFQIPRSTAGLASFDIEQLETIFSESLTIEAQENDKSTGVFDVALFELNLTADVSKESLWAAYTYGSNRFEVGQPHVLAIYRAINGSWEEVDRQALADDLDTPSLEPSPEYLDVNGVHQVRIEPTNLWFEVSGGTGAHSGTYNLLRFDGEKLYTEVAGFSSSPNAGSLVDLDGDDQPEVILNATDYYVFCYACGVQAIDYTVLRWNGAGMEPITLVELPASAPDTLRTLNSQALEFAQAGLWKDALTTVQQLSDDEIEQDEALGRNILLIELIAESRRKAAEDNEAGYPLLDYVFYGDYANALELMRDYQPSELFTTQSALIAGTVAEGWEGVLADQILKSAEPALAAALELAPVHFLKGWAVALVDQDDPTVLEEIRLASELAPDDSLMSASLTFLENPGATLDSAASVAIELEEPEPEESGTEYPEIEEEDTTPEIILRATPRPTTTATSRPTATKSKTPTPKPRTQPAIRQATPTPVPPTSLPPTPIPLSSLSIETTDAEEIIALNYLNIRMAPGTDSVVLERLAPGLTLKVVGRIGQGENLWWQVVYPPNSTGLAWVSGDIRLSVPTNADRETINLLPPTPLPTYTPFPTFTSPPLTNTFTPVPTHTFTPIPTSTFTPIPTNTFIPWTNTPTFTPPPTWTFTPLPTPTPIETPTPLPSPTPLPTPVVAPVSGRILYSAQGAGGYDILVHQIGSGATSDFVVGGGVQPDLNPQNNVRIAYYSISNDNKGLRGYDIGTGIRIQFDRFVEDSLPTWNPQGNQIAFASNRAGDRRWRVYVVWADGQSEARDIAYGLDPAWWPFGNFIVYKGCNQQGGQCGLWTVGADGSDQQPLTNVTSDSRPTWAPDGNRIVFMSNERHGNWDLYVVDANDGNNVRQLTTSPAHDGLPAVSPDGQYVAFYTNRAGNWGIWYIPLNGQGIAQPLIPDIGPLPDWLIQGLDWVP